MMCLLSQGVNGNTVGEILLPIRWVDIYVTLNDILYFTARYSDEFAMIDPNTSVLYYTVL